MTENVTSLRRHVARVVEGVLNGQYYTSYFTITIDYYTRYRHCHDSTAPKNTRLPLKKSFYSRNTRSIDVTRLLSNAANSISTRK